MNIEYYVIRNLSIIHANTNPKPKKYFIISYTPIHISPCISYQEGKIIVKRWFSVSRSRKQNLRQAVEMREIGSVCKKRFILGMQVSSNRRKQYGVAMSQSPTNKVFWNARKHLTPYTTILPFEAKIQYVHKLKKRFHVNFVRKFNRII